MSRRDEHRLRDILAAYRAIQSHLARADMNDDLVFDAVCMRLIEIGEAVTALDPALLAREPDIRWSGAKGLRNHLAHRYFDTVHAVVTETVTSNLPPLIEAVERLLTDEALHTQERPLIVFRDGPAGRRAGLVGGPDVWEVARAVRSTRESEPRLPADAVLALVSDNSGVEFRLIRAAVEYWSAFPAEIDDWVDRAHAMSVETEQLDRTE